MHIRPSHGLNVKPGEVYTLGWHLWQLSAGLLAGHGSGWLAGLSGSVWVTVRPGLSVLLAGHAESECKATFPRVCPPVMAF